MGEGAVGEVKELADMQSAEVPIPGADQGNGGVEGKAWPLLLRAGAVIDAAQQQALVVAHRPAGMGDSFLVALSLPEEGHTGCMSCAIATTPPELEQRDTEQLPKVSQNGLSCLGSSQGLHHLMEMVGESPGDTGEGWGQNQSWLVKVCSWLRAGGQRKPRGEGTTVGS